MSNINNIPQMVCIRIDKNAFGWYAYLLDIETKNRTQHFIDINSEVVMWNHRTCYHVSRKLCIEAIENIYIIIDEKEEYE